jgi:hypothetical protein
MKGPGVVSEFYIEEGQTVTFILRDQPKEGQHEGGGPVTPQLCENLLQDTLSYWSTCARNFTLTTHGLMDVQVDPQGAVQRSLARVRASLSFHAQGLCAESGSAIQAELKQLLIFEPTGAICAAAPLPLHSC